MPITAPVLLIMGIEPIWLGVMMGVLLQTSFLTPRFGVSLFYLRGVAPAAIRTAQVYRSAAVHDVAVVTLEGPRILRSIGLVNRGAVPTEAARASPG